MTTCKGNISKYCKEIFLKEIININFSINNIFLEIQIYVFIYKYFILKVIYRLT